MRQCLDLIEPGHFELLDLHSKNQSQEPGEIP